MTTTMQIKARITPWDDQAFVQAFDRARDEVHALEETGGIGDSKAAALVQHRLREAGYPSATVEVLRTPAEALEHTSNWIVLRDG